MIDSEVCSIVTQLGFPIVVCLWFMIRTEKVIGNNTKVMHEVMRKL